MRTPESVQVAVRSAIRLVGDPFTVGDVLKALHTCNDHVQVRRVIGELVQAGELTESEGTKSARAGTRHFYARTPAFRGDVYDQAQQLRSGKLVQDIAFAWGHQRCQRFKDEHAE